MRTLKKGLAMLVVALMLFSLLPATVLAGEQPGRTPMPTSTEAAAPEGGEKQDTEDDVQPGEGSGSDVPSDQSDESDGDDTVSAGDIEQKQKDDLDAGEDEADSESNSDPSEDMKGDDTQDDGDQEDEAQGDSVQANDAQEDGGDQTGNEEKSEDNEPTNGETNGSGEKLTDDEANTGDENDEENTEDGDSGDDEEAELSYELSSIGVYIGDTYIPVILESSGGMMPMSLLPLNQHWGTLDLSEFFPEELKAVTLQTVLKNTSVSPKLTGTQIAWAKGAWYDECTDFHILGEDGTIDLSPVGSSSSTSMYMQIISGPDPTDQTNAQNERYLIRVELPSFRDLFTFQAQTEAGQSIEFINTHSSYSSYNGEQYSLIVSRDNREQLASQKQSLTITLDSSKSKGASLDGIYAGNLTEEEIAAATPIAEGTYTANYFGYPDQQFTAVLSKGDFKNLVHFSVGMLCYGIGVSCDGLYNESGDSVYQSWRSSTSGRVETCTFVLKENVAVNDTYYLRLSASDSETGAKGVACIKLAVVGHYTSLAEAAGQTDIKAELFGSSGYSADYSQGIEFTIIDTEDYIWHYKILTAPYEEPAPVQPTPSADTYFQIVGAKKADTEGEYQVYYISDKEIDSEGTIHQTVMLLDGGKPVTAENIKPVFYTRPKVNVYLGLDQVSGTKQESGVSEVPFRNGEAIAYSAAAEDGKHLQNYWVTFVTPQQGAKLFVNGTNAETLYDEDEKLPVRVLHLGDIEDPDAEYHDILISNMGDQPLTGLYVRLEGAQNVQIDPYWTITENGTRTLGAFSTTSANKSYGELPNFARIRLLPEYDENGEIISGIVSGYLVIGGDGVDEVKIKLTGSAGKPKIVTEEILDGVKYVPYASLIQTNNTGDTDAVRFELENVSGDTGLPNGVEMYPDGELYGVPLVDGEFTFHVKLIASKNSSILDEAAFTMKVILNTDDNVWGASDGGYSVLDYIGELAAPGGGILDGTQHYLLPDYIEQVFRSEGEYEYFIDFYLDGQKLASGVDYTSQAGSTVITIFEQTLTNAGSGTHTIAAEFHEKETSDGTPDGSLKRTAQNYTINVEPKVPTPSTSQPTTPSTPAPTATPDTTPTAKPSTTPAVPTASPEGTPPVNTPEPVGTPKPGAGTDTNTPSSGAGNQQAPSVVDCQVFLVDGGGNALVNYALELHSTPMTAVTNEAGMASFSRVAFGAHTIFALGTTGKPVASKSFTFVSGYSVALNGDIITVRPGGTVKLTMRLDGNTLELVSADTAIPKTGDDSPIEVYLVTACVAATALGTLLVYMRKKRSNI